MISFLHPEDQAALPSLQPIADKIAKAHAELTNQCILEALYKQFGTLPPLDEIAKHVVCAVDQDNVSHYVWVETKPEIGETLDMSDVLCSIAPPAIFNPEKPHQ